ncbi:DUF1059 domain-containing protein [Kineococcus sp. SYSU DK003]|uniref:DUF1059 domain-containing protein n=1 Tax=Kineococcus sp. SYSU DK003 TaxID=3383124 RepID=UPI003D7D2B70
MKAFRCGDVVPGCRREFTGTDREDILAQVAEHARADHGVTEVDLTLVQAVEANLREA